MNRLINNNCSATYSILIHSVSMSSIVEFHYYEKTSTADCFIAMQYFGRSIPKLKNKYNQNQDLFIFEEKDFYNFVNKLDEFVKSDTYPRSTYFAKAASSNSAALQLCKKSDTDFIITRSENIYDALDNNYIWSFTLSNTQANELLIELQRIKSKLLDNSG